MGLYFLYHSIMDKNKYIFKKYKIFLGVIEHGFFI